MTFDLQIAFKIKPNSTIENTVKWKCSKRGKFAN